MTHANVPLRRHGDGQPSSHTYGHVEDVVRVGVHVAHHDLTRLGVALQHHEDDEVHEVVQQLKRVRHGQC